MYLKSIILDGFKSYGSRTEIMGFDPMFNAITGLNGSGKSNILDAICFVLGLSSLQQVRASVMQDLIFKQGKTGISKASVTLTFDNSNKKASPTGYESYNEIVIGRHVVIGGENKYVLNGLNSSSKAITALFNSMQMNVNNPNFLVMQGRITKVLHMKPMEILSMIEEASGTKVFECKKGSCKGTIQKKGIQLAQVDCIMHEDIAPKLAELKKQREHFLEYKKVKRELEHLQKVYTAWVYYKSKKKSEEGNLQLEEFIKKLTNSQKMLEEGKIEIVNIDAKVQSLQKEMDLEKGGAITSTQSTVDAKTSALNVLLGDQKGIHENIKDEEKCIKQIASTIVTEENELQSKVNALQKIESNFNRLKEVAERDKKELDQAQEKLQALNAGLISDGTGNETTLQDQLIKCRRELADAQLKTETINKRKLHCKSQLSIKSTESKNLDNQFRKDYLTRSKLEKELESLKLQLPDYDSKEKEKIRLEKEVTNCRSKCDECEQKDSRFSFRYQDPEPSFDRRSVHGLVCRLIKIEDPKFFTALEKTAGSRFFDVVVDTDTTSTKLLKNGQLERRTTIIPLNKISGRRLHPKVVETAKSRGGVPALSLIRYKDHLQPAMEFIFGSTLICKDFPTAEEVCYHPDVRTKCITLRGDILEPGGVASGGSEDQRRSIQETQAELIVAQERLEEAENLMAKFQREQNVYGGFQNFKLHIERVEEQLHAVNARLEQADQSKEEVEMLEKQIIEFNEQLEECQKIIKEKTIDIKQLEAKNNKVNLQNELKNVTNDVKKWTAKANASRNEVEERQGEYNTLVMESRVINESIAKLKAAIENHKEKIENLSQEDGKLASKISEARECVASAKDKLKSAKDVFNKKNKEITQDLQRRDQLNKQLTEFELDIKQIEKDHDKLKQAVKDSRNRAAEMLKEHDWISQDEQFFGKPNGVYDFQEPNPNELATILNNLKERKDVLGRNLNTKAMTLLQKTDDQFTELVGKREQVDVDKDQILTVIGTLSVKREEAIKNAFTKVNQDFKSIFSSLLPGAMAQLVAVDSDPLHGVEFRVGFGGKWKEDLTELSGGQRSLVALSLILAMLLFNPAPIYILDEVDAALDLSHTQNIGLMLKNHFTTSQFIIVSLKDGMFSNANVLFRTKFVDGLSTISRTVQNKALK